MIPITNISMPLFAKSNSHHIHLYIGIPPQRRIVIVDTGSQLLVFPCKPCRTCGSHHVSGSFFDPMYSSTDVRNQCVDCVFSKTSCFHDKCTFHQSYTEGSTIQGYELEDIVWPGTSNIEQSTKVFMQLAVPMTFGCESHETGLIASQFADGIMGLSLKEDNIVSKMYQAGSIPYNAFSICLTNSHGILSFGGTSASLLSHNDDNTNSKVDDNKFLLGIEDKKPRHLEKMKMVPISKHFGYYSIDIHDFQLGGISITSKLAIKSIFNGGKGTIIDSGTSDTYLPKQIEKDFNRVWYQFTKQTKLKNSLQQYTETEFERLPNITFVLEGGHEWTIQPSEYMEKAKRDKGFYNRIYLDEPKGAVLGANAMINHDILFDMNNGVIGIAKAECS